VTSVIFNIPLPPSVNALYANKRRGGRTKTRAYKAWLDEAGQMILAQRARVTEKRVAGRYDLLIEVGPSRRDLGNMEKCVSDLLVKMNVVDDDKHCRNIHLKVAEFPGCRVTVTASMGCS